MQEKRKKKKILREKEIVKENKHVNNNTID